MKTLADIRKEYPQYADMSDEDLGRALHSKFYSDMPYEQFAQRAGIAAPKPQPEPSFIDSAKEQAMGFARSGGILARDVIEGGLGTVGILTDPAVLTLGSLTDQNFATGQQTGQQFADFLGLPKPQGGVEQGISQVQQAVTGGGGLVALSRQAAKRLPGLAGQVFERMAANPGTQIASAAGAAAGSEVAGQTAENIGFSPEIQAGARVFGGLAGGLSPLARNYVTSPFEASAARTMRQDVPNIDELVSRPAPSRTPGVVRTLAEETLDPDVVNLERRITATGATAVPNRAISNEAAQVAEIQRLAGSPADLATAQAARDAAATPLRNQALRQDRVDVTRVLSEISRAQKRLEGRPIVQKALAELKQLVSNANKMAPGQPASPILDAAGNPMTPATQPTPIGANARELYEIRNTIGDMLEGRFGGEAGVQLRGMKELIAAREALDRIVSRQVPEYGQYLSTYRDLSRPVNRLQVAQEVERRAVRSDTGGDVNRLMPGAFVQATEGVGTTSRRAGANALARDATQFNKANTASILSPDDIATLQSIRNDLIRTQQVGGIRAKTASGGSQTALTQNLTQEARAALSGLLAKIPGVRSLQASARVRVENAIAEALANPERARAILARFPSSEQSAARNAMMAVGITLEPTSQE